MVKFGKRKQKGTKEKRNLHENGKNKSKSNVTIEQLDIFEKSFKKLKKKYPHIADDINPFIEGFWNSKFPGSRDKDFSYPVYKLRIPNSDRQSGLRGGYRLIYLKKENTFVLLMLLYSKTDQDDLTTDQIKILDRELSFFYKSKGWD